MWKKKNVKKVGVFQHYQFIKLKKNALKECGKKKNVKMMKPLCLTALPMWQCECEKKESEKESWCSWNPFVFRTLEL